ncbi:hypothetical protein ACFLQU_00925 [Verrucomicrobiota bacterium]
MDIYQSTRGMSRRKERPPSMRCLSPIAGYPLRNVFFEAQCPSTLLLPAPLTFLSGVPLSGFQESTSTIASQPHIQCIVSADVADSGRISFSAKRNISEKEIAMNAEKKTIIVPVRMTEAMRKRLGNRAWDDRLFVAQLVRQAITKELERRDKEDAEREKAKGDWWDNASVGDE